MSEGYQALTDKEKETLRLVVRGYDAKSLARRLGISVHTVNERLRRARRKMEVSSSREAARLVFAEEGGAPDFLADEELGEANADPAVGQDKAPEDARRRLAWIVGGALAMSFTLALIALSSMAQIAQPAAEGDRPENPDAESVPAPVGGEVVRSAEQWLALVDDARWDESWNATGQAFKQLNTSKTWAFLSEEVRPPLGRVVSRSAISQESVPAPPHGYEMIKFRTSFANKAEATETLALTREGSDWRVVGYWIS